MRLASVLALVVVLVVGAASRADIIVSSGYYDLSPAASGGGPPLPDPWIGSANTSFFGSKGDLANAVSSDPDIAGLLVQNTGTGVVTLMNLSLSSGIDVLGRARTPDGNLPLGDVKLLPGQNYIFAVGDGSDSGLQNETINITLNAINFKFADAKTTLAPFGVLDGNRPQLGGGDETQPWTQDADLLRAVPEPSSLALCGIGIGGVVSLVRHRRKRVAAQVAP